LSEDLGVGDLDEVDVVLGTEGLDELEVLGCDKVTRTMLAQKYSNEHAK
jgi:hypothetical protein